MKRAIQLAPDSTPRRMVILHPATDERLIFTRERDLMRQTDRLALRCGFAGIAIGLIAGAVFWFTSPRLILVPVSGTPDYEPVPPASLSELKEI